MVFLRLYLNYNIHQSFILLADSTVACVRLPLTLEKIGRDICVAVALIMLSLQVVSLDCLEMYTDWL